MNWKNRSYCGKLSLSDAGKTVELSGWIDTIRDHGQVLFMHLRDVSGFVQIVFDPEANKDAHSIGERLRAEYAVTIHGVIKERSTEAKNPSIKTGDIELHVSDVTIHSSAETPPFMVTEKSASAADEATGQVDEDLRLKYRYLDLRRPSMQHRLISRYRILKIIRDYLDERGFCEVETPVLTKSTPEGARDYLVPSRVHHGQFYALPQSPQLFKQLLMVGGMDRYFQIVKCFRDEDLRPNRQPEFTQLDLEASFIDESFIQSLMEGLMEKVFASVGKTIKGPFPHMTYDTAMNVYGSDKPDLRFGLEMVDVSPLLKHVGFSVFQSLIASGGTVKAINVKNRSEQMSKNYLQEDLAKKIVPKFGGKGMAWMKMENGQLQSNIVQFFSDEEQKNLIEAMKAENGDVLLFIADKSKAKVNDILGRLRLFIGEKFNFIDPKSIVPLWVTDFPLFEINDGVIASIHHPFTAPSGDILNAKTEAEILALNSRGYDMVINGEEVGGGSIRIHQSDIQQKVFELLGLSEDEIQAKFGWFVQALKYGTPPHGGIALGIDRLICMLLDTDNIREVIAFPKNRMAYCPLTQAPSDVASSQLDELHINVQPKLEIN